MKILAADIGGTNARFAVFVDGRCVVSLVFSSTNSRFKGERSGALIILKGLKKLGEEVNVSGIQAACIAVAGPVSDGFAKLTNVKLQFIASELTTQFGYPFTLINDLHAMGLGLDRLGSETLVQIGSGQSAKSGGHRSVVAVGTGLGMSIVTGYRKNLVVIPTEGGHMPVAAVNPFEKELVTAAEARTDAVTYEYFVSGPGLVNLYDAVCDVWGAKSEALTPEAVSERGLEFDPVCHKTLETFVGFLGTATSILGLMALPTGGVFIGGIIGIVLRPILEAGNFRRHFEGDGIQQEVLKDVPTWLVSDTDFGILGAAQCAEGTRSRAASRLPK